MKLGILSLFMVSAVAAAKPSSVLSTERIIHPLGDAHLLIPQRCEPACPLVVVSHSRGMSANDSLKRPHLQRLFNHFVSNGYAVLISNDAGERSWGQPTTLMYLSQIRERAIRKFPFNGNTYTFGYSMGGLPALLSAFKNVFPVSGVILLDARVNLLNAWQGSDRKRRAEIAQAHQVNETDPLPVGADPLNDYQQPEILQIPVFVAGSYEDRTVPFTPNGEALYQRSASRESQLMVLSGPHLGATHFGRAVQEAVVSFMDRLEHLDRVGARQSALQARTGSPIKVAP